MALRLLKANLPNHLNSAEDRCTILEFALRQPLAEKTAAVLAEKPRILALSVSIWNHAATLELLRALETKWAEKPLLILGGPELSPLAQLAPFASTAEIFGYADFVIRGEAESAFAGLCQAIIKDPETVKKTYSKFIEGGEADLKSIKSAYDMYTEEDLEHKLIYVESSRGCPYSCAFCQSAAAASVREFPLKAFFYDMDRLLQRCRGKTKTIKFLDRSFNVKPTRAVKILEFCYDKIIKEEKNKFQFHFEMVPSVFPEELFEILSRFPPETIRIEIGVQSFNPETNKAINRICNPEKELKVICILREKTKAILHVDLIAGLPGEDLLSFGNGFDRLWIALSQPDNAIPFEIQPGILKCLPGTPVYEMAENGDFSVEYNVNPPYEVIGTDCLSVSDMEKIKNFARFWELIVNRHSFQQLIQQLVPPGKPVFNRFLEISHILFGTFGKNWGIPKNDLGNELLSIINPE